MRNYRRWMELLMLAASVVIVTCQDTLLHETHNTYKPLKYGNAGNTGPGEWQAELTRLEERMEHRVREAERRVLRRLHEKLHLQNQSQSSATHDLQKVVERLSQHMDDLRESVAAKDDLIDSLRQQVTHQQHELHKQKNSLERLEQTVSNLSELVEQLLQDRLTSVTPTASTSDVAASTTPVPFSPMFPVDCEDVYLNGGMKYPGYYYIMIHPYLSKTPFKVCCSMTNHSGWTLIQRRDDGSVDFYRSWDEYKKGFGNLEGEFWLGLDHLYQLTNQGDYKLRIEMVDWDDKQYWAEYDHFRVSSESDKYRLHVHGYHGNAGDSLTSPWNSHDKMMFSTKDSDNDNRFYDNCAEHYHGAWWFKSCFESHLNGVYYHKGAHNNYFVRNGVQWNTIHTHSSLKQVMMMVKPTKDVHHDTTDYVNGVD